MAEAKAGVKSLWSGQLRRAALWIPLGLAMGILLRLGYWENVCGAALVIGLGLAALRVPRNLFFLIMGWGLACVAFGAAAMEVRLRSVEAPILLDRFDGEVSGRIRAIEKTNRGAPRLLLDNIELTGVAWPITPRRVRIALLDDAASKLPEIGARITLKAALSAPPGPAAPGAFDFSRQAWFAQIGAVGYAREKATVIAGAHKLPLSRLALDAWRREIATMLSDRMEPDIAGVAAALTIGDRSKLPRTVVESLRDSGLAHLLAISGLHMGLLTALVFSGLRLLLAVHPFTSERVPSRKLAALAALVCGAGYLLMSGSGVATQRAFIMAGVALVAILLDQNAVTLRSLAVAACIILLMRPEALFSAGFQMSFAAVGALIASYEVTRGFWLKRAQLTGWRAWFLTALLASLMTSFVAGLATAPFGAFHFNRLVLYGLAANLLAMPIMAFVIMPCILLFPIFALVGLEHFPLWIMGVGIASVLSISDLVAGLEGGVRGVAAAPDVALGAVLIGGLWLFIWRGGLRLFGLIPILAGLLIWGEAQRFDLLLRSDGRLIAGRTADGALWISEEKRASYTAETWLRRDGVMPPNRVAAYARRQWGCDRDTCSGTTRNGWTIILLKREIAQAVNCAPKTFVIVPSKSLGIVAAKGCHILRFDEYRGAVGFGMSLPESGGSPEITAAYPWRPPLFQ